MKDDDVLLFLAKEYKASSDCKDADFNCDFSIHTDTEGVKKCPCQLVQEYLQSKSCFQGFNVGASQVVITGHSISVRVE